MDRGKHRVSVTDSIKRKCREFILDTNELKKIMKLFLSDVQKGLSKKTHSESSVKCYITYVQDLPSGKERGKFLALDLAGFTFRILLIELGKSYYFDVISKTFTIPNNILNGKGHSLFDHIAECLAVFMQDNKLTEEHLPLALTVGFELNQQGLRKAILKSLSKGFNCPGLIGNDVVALLNTAIERREDIDVQVCAVLNDTTGTLMSCAWERHNTRIGFIIGDGTNACYLEDQRNTENFIDNNNGSGKVIVNTEWGAFGEDGSLNFIRTEYDKEVDMQDIYPGVHVFEKLTCGMYLGELIRVVLEKFTRQNLLLGGRPVGHLFKKKSLTMEYVSVIESDPVGSHKKCSHVLEELGIKNASEQDCLNIRYICECITTRSAYLVAATLAVLINKVDESSITVGVDGSLYRQHPNYHNILQEKLKEFVKPNIDFELRLSQDGSGRGAALVAAVTTKIRKPTDDSASASPKKDGSGSGRGAAVVAGVTTKTPKPSEDGAAATSPKKDGSGSGRGAALIPGVTTKTPKPSEDGAAATSPKKESGTARKT